MTEVLSLDEWRARRQAFSLAGTLDAVAPHVPPALVPPPAWAAVRRAAARLPAALAAGFYLECRLRDGDARVDLIVRVDEPGRDLLAGRNPVLRLPSGFALDPAWEKVAAFCRRWADEPGGPWRALRHLWLEFDLGEEGSWPGPVPTPSIFAGFDPEGSAGFGDGEWTAAFDAFAAVLLDDGGAAAREAAHRALRARPAGTGVPYLGFMLSRPGGPARVYVGDPPPAEVAPFLARLGVPGPLLAEVEGTLGALAPAPRIGMVHVDVGAGVLPRCGVEHTFERPGQLRGTLAEGAYLDRLVERGLCAAAKGEALRAWPGVETRTLAHELWPSHVLRRLNCVKLLHEAGRPPEAKAYLLTLHPPAARRAWPGAAAP